MPKKTGLVIFRAKGMGAFECYGTVSRLSNHYVKLLNLSERLIREAVRHENACVGLCGT